MKILIIAILSLIVTQLCCSELSLEKAIRENDPKKVASLVHQDYSTRTIELSIYSAQQEVSIKLTGDMYVTTATALIMYSILYYIHYSLRTNSSFTYECSFTCLLFYLLCLYVRAQRNSIARTSEIYTLLKKHDEKLRWSMSHSHGYE